MKAICGKVQGALPSSSSSSSSSLSSRMRMWIWMWMLRLGAILLLFLQLLALGSQLWSQPYHHNQRSLFMSHGSFSSSSSVSSSSASSSASASSAAASSSTTYYWFVRDPLRFTLEKPLLHRQRLSSLPRSASLHAFSFSHSKDSIMPELAISRLRTRLYKSNGYLMISCNGGLNQMRAAICDMVAVAKLLNLTLIVPELDKTSFWNDPSNFSDIFDADHFVASLRDEVRIIKEVPRKFRLRVRNGLVLTMPPVSWSNESYYLQQILPLVRRHRIVRFNRTDTRVANGGPGISAGFQKLRCRANYEALAFAPGIRELGHKLVERMRSRGKFLVLHLRYEMDMLAFSGCTHGCTLEEVAELTRMRYAYPWWKEKEIDPQQKRSDGLCPLTPEETLLVLAALGFGNGTQIYIASGKIYGGDRRMKGLYTTYPDMVKKEVLLSRDELARFENHSSQMAALDYLVAIESDVFMATHDGNMAKLVEGHRRYLGYRKTILLDRKRLVELFDGYRNGTLDWAAFSSGVREAHEGRMGGPMKRRVVLDRPKEEDYFYSNPHECLHQP